MRTPSPRHRDARRRTSFPVAAALLTVLSIALCSPSGTAAAETTRSVGFDFAYYPGDRQGYGVSPGGFAPVTYTPREPDGGTADGQRVLGTTWGNVEAKGYFAQSWRWPALRWSEGALAKDNSILLRATTGVSPISATQELRVTLTPVAVLQFTGAVLVGTGWNVRLFDGLGTVDLNSGEVDPASFEGLVLRGVAGATVQFDLAAVVPGEWNHIVAVVSPQWTLQHLTGASNRTPWAFEADDGTNYNGWEYRTTAFLGYQPPRGPVATVGILYEGERLVGAAVDRARDSAPADFDPAFRTDRIGLVANLAFGPAGRHSLTILPQLRRDRLATDTTIFNAGVQRRETVGGYWDVYRVALQYRYALE